MAMHEGHRDRLKSRFRKEGLGGFEELYVLELLLFYCIPRRDTNPIAHNLLEKFGTLNRVLSASPEELKSVDGVSDSVVTYFQFLLQLERYRQVRKDEENIKIITCQNNAFARLGGVFINQRNENVFVMCLDSKGKILGVFQVNEGNVSSSSINARRIIEICLNANATYVILAHNHPGGFAVASYQDRYATAQLANTMETVELFLLDHIVFADGDATSMATSGLYVPTHSAPFYDFH